MCDLAYTDFWAAYGAVSPSKRHRAVGAAIEVAKPAYAVALSSAGAQYTEETGLMVTVHRLEIADSLLNPTRDEHIVHLEGPTQELVGPLDLMNKRRV